jgi:hypothetical protein
LRIQLKAGNLPALSIKGSHVGDFKVFSQFAAWKSCGDHDFVGISIRSGYRQQLCLLT